ncbi:proline-rich protein 2-like [Cinclus cinclus]|uniref:proline-rich protein 2-like n=1 Tax=Cinclus cinclus TaxID=127875 RepID=UPI002E0D7614
MAAPASVRDVIGRRRATMLEALDGGGLLLVRDSAESEGRSLLRALITEAVARSDQVLLVLLEVPWEQFQVGLSPSVRERLQIRDFFGDPLGWLGRGPPIAGGSLGGGPGGSPLPPGGVPDPRSGFAELGPAQGAPPPPLPGAGGAAGGDPKKRAPSPNFGPAAPGPAPPPGFGGSGGSGPGSADPGGAPRDPRSPPGAAAAAGPPERGGTPAADPDPPPRRILRGPPPDLGRAQKTPKSPKFGGDPPDFPPGAFGSRAGGEGGPDPPVPAQERPRTSPRGPRGPRRGPGPLTPPPGPPEFWGKISQIWDPNKGAEPPVHLNLHK